MGARRAASLAVLVTTAIAASLGAAAGEIRGRVVGGDGLPVRKAVVRVLPPCSAGTPIETGDDGTFVAPSLAGASFTVRVESPGYAPHTREGVEAGDRIEVALVRGYRLSGVVRGASEGTPIAGATVAAWDRDAEPFGEAARRTATTGDDGRFTIADLPLGAMTVEASAPGHIAARLANVPVPQPAIDESGSPREIAIVLEEGARLSGRVVKGRGGTPVEGARVNVRVVEDDRPEGAAPSVATDARGSFSFDGLAAGRYVLAVAAKGLPSIERGPFALRAGGARPDVEIRLDARAAIAVRLLDPDGAPVEGLAVELGRGARAADGGDRTVREEIVDDDRIERGKEGRFTVRNLEPGTLSIRLVPEGWDDVVRDEIALRNDATTDLGTIVVRAGRNVRGRVTDTSGEPIEGAEVVVTWRDGPRARTRSASTKVDGRYRVAGIAPSPIESIRVSAERFASARREGDPVDGAPVDFVLEPSGVVTGRVVGSDGDSLRGIAIVLRPESDRGGSEGRVIVEPSGAFRVEDVDPGSYTIEASADGHATVKEPGVSVTAGGVVDVGTLRLRSGLVLRGRVLAAADGSPVGAASVRVDRSGSPSPPADAAPEPTASAYSEGDGSFTVGGLDAGSYDVTVRHPRFARARATVVLGADHEAREILVELFRGGTLAGTVVDADGKPVGGAWIGVFDASGAHVQTAVTDADGHYVVDSLPPGTYSAIRLRQGGEIALGPGARTVVIREGETTTADFDAAPTITLHGRVLRGDAPLPSVELSLISLDGPTPPDMKRTRSDADGLYRIGLDRAGRYRALVATGNVEGGGGAKVTTLSIPDQPDVLQDIVLAVFSITGRVTRVDGEPIPETAVAALSDGTIPGALPQQAVAVTDKEGRFRLGGIDEGSYRITARHRDYKSADVHPVLVDASSPEPVVDLVLEDAATIRGRVVDPSGNGVPRVVILGANPGALAAGLTVASSDPKGEFKIKGPGDGAVTLTAIPTDWAPAVVENVLPRIEDDGDPGLVIPLTRGGSLRVVVRDRDDNPVPGVQLSMRPRPSFAGWDQIAQKRPIAPTDRDGVSFINLVRPGDYVVSAPLLEGSVPVVVGVYEGSVNEAVIVAP